MLPSTATTPSTMTTAMTMTMAMATATAPPPLPTPTSQQLHYMDSELTMFMHFSVCTFNNGCDGGQQNCGYNHTRQPWPAASFDPTGVDTEQWAQTALDLGAKQVCLTVHHSGGFALWPTKASNYSIAASPFGKSGRDITQEFVTSMRKHDLEVRVYLQCALATVLACWRGDTPSPPSPIPVACVLAMCTCNCADVLAC